MRQRGGLAFLPSVQPTPTAAGGRGEVKRVHAARHIYGPPSLTMAFDRQASGRRRISITEPATATTSGNLAPPHSHLVFGRTGIKATVP